MPATLPLCSCGCTEAHEVARRQTADGVTVVLWSDGGISGVMGIGVWGQAARSAESHSAYMRAGWLLMDEVSLYDSREVRALVKAVRSAVKQRPDTPLAYLRRVMATANAVSAPAPAPDPARALAVRLEAMGWTLRTIEVETRPGWSLLYCSVSRGDGLTVTLYATGFHAGGRFSASLTREVVRWNERATNGMRYTGAWDVRFLGRDRLNTMAEATNALAGYVESNAPASAIGKPEPPLFAIFAGGSV